MITGIFNNTEYPSFEESFSSLVDSISKEEEALAKLIQCEAEKIKKHSDFPLGQSPNELLRFVQSTKRITDLFIMKEWLLCQKIQCVLILEKKIIENESYMDEFYNEE